MEAAEYSGRPQWIDLGPAGSASDTRATARQVTRLLVAPVFLAVGLWLTVPTVLAHIRFADAPRVPAVVAEAVYGKPEARQSPERIRVRVIAADGSTSSAAAEVDDINGAPGGLVPGERVTVLAAPDRPGHVLFPEQLGWWSLVFPGLLLCGIGLATSVLVLANAQLRPRSR
ncbi:hypothetical protein ABT095_29650 [Kitasatospora sp. NPDC002227]|uniref:hypothetical protein n=1 Tax=Kitasatospora sp. NPDC002227 TaxID=3154773 RepID=UPI0033306CF9